MTRARDIELLLRSGKSLRSRLFDVKKMASDHTHARVAIIVPKFGFSAVQRNKLKRRVRELAREYMLSLERTYDTLLRTRQSAYQATFDELRAEIARIATEIA